MLFHPDTPSELLPTGTLDRTESGAENEEECLLVHPQGWEDVYGWFEAENLQTMRAAVAAHFVGKEEGWYYRDFVQDSGQVVFVPSMWHHAVLNLSDTVAVTQNFVSRCNLARSYSMMADLALKAKWRSLMLDAHPELAARHMQPC